MESWETSKIWKKMIFPFSLFPGFLVLVKFFPGFPVSWFCGSVSLVSFIRGDVFLVSQFLGFLNLGKQIVWFPDFITSRLSPPPFKKYRNWERKFLGFKTGKNFSQFPVPPLLSGFKHLGKAGCSAHVKSSADKVCSKRLIFYVLESLVCARVDFWISEVKYPPNMF